MSPAPSSSTRVLALLGDPVRHSLSPAFQNAALRATGRDAVYVALRCGEPDLPGLLQGLARAGGGGNVTVPHKGAAAEVVEEVTEAVQETGACNTFWLENGRIWGDNTDVAGFGAAAEALLGSPPSGGRVLLLGAGGAARAALCSLVRSGADEVVLLNRSPERARELADRFSGRGTTIELAPAAGALAGERFDLVVNATSLGLRDGDHLPLPFEEGPAVGAALDLVYRPNRTDWIRTARARGIPAEDGLEMLLQQGAAAFQRWWGAPAPIDAMRGALPPR